MQRLIGTFVFFLFELNKDLICWIWQTFLYLLIKQGTADIKNTKLLQHRPEISIKPKRTLLLMLLSF